MTTKRKPEKRPADARKSADLRPTPPLGPRAHPTRARPLREGGGRYDTGMPPQRENPWKDEGGQ